MGRKTFKNSFFSPFAFPFISTSFSNLEIIFLESLKWKLSKLTRNFLVFLWTQNFSFSCFLPLKHLLKIFMARYWTFLLGNTEQRLEKQEDQTCYRPEIRDWWCTSRIISAWSLFHQDFMIVRQIIKLSNIIWPCFIFQNLLWFCSYWQRRVWNLVVEYIGKT